VSGAGKQGRHTMLVEIGEAASKDNKNSDEVPID